MDELLGAILGAIFELLIDCLFEVMLAEGAGLLSRLIRRFRVSVRRSNPIVATVVFALVGLGLGFFSVVLAPHPLLHPSRFHGVSLLISPVISGLVMAWIGRAWRRRGRDAVQIESFSYGFVFALAIALVRFGMVG